MVTTIVEGMFQVYSTIPESIPQSKSAGVRPPSGAEYFRQVVDAAQWSEKYGCTGSLIYSNNSLVDPWAVAQLVLENTDHLAPLVAVQPVLMKAYMVAKKLATLSHLYDRRVDINMVAGGFPNDLKALCEATPHDQRYARLTEYTTIILELLRSKGLVTYEGEFCTVRNLRLLPEIKSEHLPVVTLAGSSDASRAAADALNAVAIMYLKPTAEYAGQPLRPEKPCGARIGIITRPSADDAWNLAWERYPADRRGDIAHAMARNTSDSVWHEQLSSVDTSQLNYCNPYWLVPFETYKTMCPYYVGSYERVAREIADIASLGPKLFILDIPACEEELYHTMKVFDIAASLVGRPQQKGPTEGALPTFTGA